MAETRMPEQGAIFLQVATPRSADAVRQSLERHLRVLAGGVGTSNDPAAVWFEVTCRTVEEPLPAAKDVLGLLLPVERLRSFQRVTKGAGKDLARQFDMFGGTA